MMALMRFIAILLVAFTLAAPASGIGPRAWVSVETTHPFVVEGARFQPREHVRVVVWANGTGRKMVTAGGRGGFVVRFPGLTTAPPCGAYTVRATGDRGSHAALKVTPECAQPTAP